MEGFLADKTQSLILDALTRAAAAPAGLPLVAKTGLFAATAAGKQAAQATKSAGLVQVLRTETRGKSALEICVLTKKGLALLLEEANPRLVLEAFVKAIDRCAQQLQVLLEGARAGQDHLEAMKTHAARLMERWRQPELPASEKNGKHEADGGELVLTYLRRRQDAGTLGDCPLPELYRHVTTARPGLTLGQFHDLCRRLGASRALYLHPWTGPLYELPEPACALLAGHEVAYYASLP
jgi:hypothetical protein